MYGSGSRGWDIESNGDHWASQCDFEANTATGVYQGSGANTSITQSHFENIPTANQFEVAKGQMASSANNYEGNTALIDSGAVFVSTGMDNLTGVTLTNNSTGGSSGLIGATIENPLYGPIFGGNGLYYLDQQSGIRQQVPGAAVWGTLWADSLPTAWTSSSKPQAWRRLVRQLPVECKQMPVVPPYPQSRMQARQLPDTFTAGSGTTSCIG